MTPSLDLFKLIKSLSSTEKAYFKKHASFTRQDKEGNIYIRLFDAIDRQKSYDEAKLKQKFKGETFVKQFPVIKNYLYGKVLDALELYHSDMNQRFVVRKMMNRAELLRRKGMYDQAVKVVKKAKIFARENEMHIPLLDICIHVELGLALEKYDMDWVESVNKEITENLALLKNDAVMHDLNFKIAICYHRFLITRKPEYLQQVKQLIGSEYLSDVSKAKSFFGKNRFYESHAFYAQAKGDTNAIYSNTKKIVSNFENTPGKVEKNFPSYIAALNNFIDACAELRKRSEGLECIEKLKSQPQLLTSFSLRSRVFYLYNYLFLFLNNNAGYYRDSNEEIPRILNELREFETELNDSEKGLLFMNIAVTYFGVDDVKQCIRWLNKIRNELDLSHHPELDCFVRLFYLIAHYELNNNELISYLVRSDSRFFSKKENQFEVEKLFLDFLKNQLPTAKTPLQRHDLFAKLKQKFTPLANNPQDKIYFKYFDFISWFDSKIQGQPFLEIVRKKNKDQ